MDNLDNLEKWSFDEKQNPHYSLTEQGMYKIISNSEKVERAVCLVWNKEDAERITRVNDLIDGCYIAVRLLNKIESGELNLSEITAIRKMLDSVLCQVKE